MTFAVIRGPVLEGWGSYSVPLRLPISSLPLGRFQPSDLGLQSYSPASELAAQRGVCTDGSRWPTEPAARAGRGWASARAQAGSPRGEAGAQPGGVSPPHACLRSGRGEPPNLTGSGPAPAPGERSTRRPSFLPGGAPWRLSVEGHPACAVRSLGPLRGLNRDTAT